MNLKKFASRNAVFFLLAILLQARALWEYCLSPNTQTLLVGSSIALAFFVLPFPLELLSTWLERLVERNQVVGSVVVLILVILVITDSWKRHSKIWAILNAILGVFLLLAIWKGRIFPSDDGRIEERRARARNLLADRAAFEKNWERRIKIMEGIFLLFCALLAVVCWVKFFKIVAMVPALLGALLLIGLLADLTPMSDEKFEKELARARARLDRVQVRSARIAVRRAERAERLQELKKRQKPNSPAAASFSSSFYWCIVLCVIWFQDRSDVGKSDLVFLVLPAWYLTRAIYFLIRRQLHPNGHGEASVPGSPASS